MSSRILSLAVLSLAVMSPLACIRNMDPVSPTSLDTPTPSASLGATLTTTPSAGTPSVSATSVDTSIPSTPSDTPTQIFTDTPTPYPTVPGVAVLSITGNLDSRQRVDQPGGILDLAPSRNALLPFAVLPLPLNGSYAAYTSDPSSVKIQQLVDFCDPTFALGGNHAQPMMVGDFILIYAKSVFTWAWEQNPPVLYACSAVRTILDIQSNPHQITILFYQVNDLGEAGVNQPPPASQALYAWYAFETTGGVPPSSANLLGGTGIDENPFTMVAGSAPEPLDRGTGSYYFGDFLFFNTDGSLASEGGVDGTMGVQAKPVLYLPVPVGIPIPGYTDTGVPDSGYSEVLPVVLNFGTSGLLGTGQRDGLTCDPVSCNIP